MRAGAEERQMLALMWLVAACRKWKEIRVEHYYDYATRELGLSKAGARAVLERLERLGLAERITTRIVRCEKLWQYVEYTTQRVPAPWERP